MPAVNGVGEPCAREPHARFEAAGAGNGADLAKGTGVAQPPGKPAEQRPQALPPASHRASPRPYMPADRRSVVARGAPWILISGSGYDRPPGWRAGWRGFHGSLDVVKFRWRELATPLS